MQQASGGLTGFGDEESDGLVQMSSKMNPTASQQQSHNLLSPATTAILEGLEDEDTEDEEGAEGGYRGNEKRSGRRKIKIEYIRDKSRRHITFSKRKAGIMKKAYELSTLTGTQVLLLVASETGHVYTFATPKLQPLITKSEGKNLIQACLNAPEAAEYDAANMLAPGSAAPSGSNAHAAAHYYPPPPTLQSYQGRDDDGGGLYQPPSVYTLYPGRPQTGGTSNAPSYYYPPPQSQSHPNPGNASSYHSQVGHHGGMSAGLGGQPTGFWSPNTGLNSSPIKAPASSGQPYHHMNNGGHHVHSHLSHNHLHHSITNGLQQDD